MNSSIVCFKGAQALITGIKPQSSILEIKGIFDTNLDQLNLYVKKWRLRNAVHVP